ncbi:MAG: 3-hydroxybutyryl-CoA dehydrogenase [Bacteroidetes bacterium]|nr:3-hydroxybutyryl-CoA dehydrogenase [Bacteroidota bacterium]
MNISICGAGTMGRGIAIACLQAGHSVVVFDLSELAISKSKDYIIAQMNKSVEKKKITQEDADTYLKNISYSTIINDVAVCEIIIEAILEKPEAKFELFSSIENSGLADTAILATNTSSLSVNLLSSKLRNPQNFVGLHFFNPANLMKLVEIVRSRQTSDETITRCVKFIKDLGKTSVIAKDVPGFIVNRVARNYYNEAMKIATENASEPEQIDIIMKSLGFKMGPFELMDLIGNDVNLEVTKSVYEQYFHEARFTPSTMQQEIVNAGMYGRKTGKGFHKYEEK